MVFLDLRGYTAFAETAEPEEVMGVLREYHREMGTLVLAHEGTLERFAGDGMMVFFNDPVVVPNRGGARRPDGARHAGPRDRARGRLAEARLRARRRASGSPRASPRSARSASRAGWDYGAIGSVTNLAFRLCSEARPGQVLAAKRVVAAVEELVEVEAVGDLALKGFARPVPTVALLKTPGPPGGDV